MALAYVTAGFVSAYGKAFAAKAGGTWINNLSAVSDNADQTPNFDTGHEVYTNPIVDSASQDAIGDNSQGLEDPLILEPQLNYTYTTGYSTSHEQSQAVTAGVTQSFDYKFLGVGGSTTLSASGTLSWTEGTGEDKTTSVTEGGTYPFSVPKFKIYEMKLLFTQQQVTVPYSAEVTLSGDLFIEAGGATYSYGVGKIDEFFFEVGYPVIGNFNWNNADYSIDDNKLVFDLIGSLTVEGAGTSSTKVFDITNGHSQEERAEWDPSVPVGVHRFMDNAGRTFRDTPFDDYVDGGAGGDRILFRSGEDIAHGHAGDDLLRAMDVGRSLLDGGGGDDRLVLRSGEMFNTMHGGEGNDRIRADAEASMVYGGAGNDRLMLREDTAGGTVITDSLGVNRLFIDKGLGDAPAFERTPDSDTLYIILGARETYDRTRDVAWVDFFAPGSRNRVNGMDADEIAEVAVTFRMQGADDFALG